MTNDDDRDSTAKPEGEEMLRRREEELRHRVAEHERREQWFRRLIEATTDLVTVVGPDGSILYHSPSMERILGWRVEERLGRDALELIHPEDRDGAREALGRAMTRDDDVRIEVRLRHADGSWGHLEAMGRNLIGDPAVGGLLINLRDLTERRRAEAAQRRLEAQLQQSQKLEAVGVLAGGIAHDFNNLLTVVQSNASFLLDALDGQEELMEDVEEIRDAARRGANLTRQLLAFSRRQVVEPRVVSFGEVVADMTRMLRRVIGEDLDLELSVDRSLAVRADPGQLEQIVMNLVVNAREALPAGGSVRIRVGTPDVPVAGGDDPPDGWVLLSVRDDGPGMSEALRERVFEPFFSTKELGSGLGLATVYGIVEQAAGRVWIESAPGHGTRVHVALPRATGPGAPERRAEAAKTVAPTRSGTVLVVEDERVVRTVAQRSLERAGYRVLAVDDAEAALSCLGAETGIDLLLTDVVMPGMTGAELSTRVRVRFPGLPVLYMSGFTGGLPSSETLELDGPLLSKPFSPASLLAAVDQALGSGPPG